MASGDIAKELNSQLKAKSKDDSSEAEKISAAETSKDTEKSGTSDENQKEKKKDGLFKRLKNAVKAPLRRRHRQDANENGTYKARTKSTNDLTHTIAEGSDSANDGDHKAKHGRPGLFGHQFKIRTSFRKKMNASKKEGPSSEPSTPTEEHKSVGNPLKELGAGEREELVAVNSALADDSFFQISLTNDTLDSTVLSENTVHLDDFDSLQANTSGLSQQSVAQDRIRLAPKGRRKPAKFTSKASACPPVEENKVILNRAEPMVVDPPLSSITRQISGDTSESVSPTMPEKQITAEKPVTAEKPATAKKPKPPPKKALLPSKKALPKSGLTKGATTVISTDEKPQSNSNELASPDTGDLGSWEHIPMLNSEKSLSQNELSKNTNGKDKNKSTSEEEAKIDTVETKISKVDTKASVAEEKVKEDVVEKNIGQDILDLIEGKTEKVSELKNSSKVQENGMVNGQDVKPKRGSLSISDNDDDGKKQSDSLIARSSPLIERNVKESNTNKTDVKLIAKEKVTESNSNEPDVKLSTKEDSMEENSKKKWKFDLNELDDIRSTDMQPKQFQRSKSMSAAQKPSQPQLSKSTSIDYSWKYTMDENIEKDGAFSENGKVPDWVVIAKAKHQKNAPEADESLEETMEDIQEIAAKIALNENTSPGVKEKPSTLSSKIPKPSQKSQSFKKPNPSQATPTKLKHRSTSPSKAISPVSTCLVCTKPAYQFERCDVDGQVIHKNCAKCSMCSRTINVGTIRVINSKLYCGIHARTVAT